MMTCERDGSLRAKWAERVVKSLQLVVGAAWDSIGFIQWRIGLIVCLAVLVSWMCLWLSGDIGVLEIQVRDRSGRAYFAGSGAGHMALCFVDEREESERSFVTFTRFPAAWANTFLYAWSVFDDLKPFYGSKVTLASGAVSIALGFPHWVVAVPLSMWPVLAFCRGVHRYRRRRSGLCMVCGYDLRASEERCPECGVSFETNRSQSEGRGSSRLTRCYEHALLFAAGAWGCVLLGLVPSTTWARIPTWVAISTMLAAHLCGVRGCWLRRMGIVSAVLVLGVRMCCRVGQ